MGRIYINIFLTMLCLGFSATIWAQTNNGDKTAAGTINGRIVTGKGKKAVPYITVALLKEGKQPVNGALTDDNGQFEIAAVKSGSYSLKVSGIGISTYIVKNITISPDNLTRALGDIKVETTTKLMDEVEVKGERPVMEMGVDKKVFNVEKNTTTAGGSASDVLQNVPSVSVDVDGGVSLRGKSGVTILIDGKPATLLGGDEASALQSLPAESVDQVEVITNPSAKYDAEGMTGIINIVTKREKKFGVNGNANIGIGTRDKYNGGLSLNFKNEKWNIFLNGNFRQNPNYRRNTTERFNNEDAGYFNTYEDNLRQHGGSFNSIGAEYTFDKKNSVMLTQNINSFTYESNGKTNYKIYNGDNLLSIQERESRFKVNPISSSTSLEYKHKFAPLDHQLTTSVTYVTSGGSRVQYFKTRNISPNGTVLGQPIIQDAPGKGKRQSVNAQTDYERPLLTKNGKLEAGLKAQLFFFQSENNPIIDSTSGVDVAIDSSLLNSYDYTQQIYAGYTSFKDQLGKFRYQFGLRAEYAYYEGTNEQVGGRRYSNEFLNFFPSVFTSYELPKDQSIYLNYSRRTHRPRFWQLLPYLDLSNPQDTSAGNPNLVPEFIHNIELSYSRLFKKGHNIILSTYYQNTQNLITMYRRFYDDGTSFSMRTNLNTGITYGADITARFQIVKIWDATFNVNLFQNQILGGNVDPTLDNTGFSWFGKVNTNVKLPKNFSLQINGNYEAPKIEAQGTREGVYWIDAAIRKNLLKDKATLVLNVSDIFDTRKYTVNYDFDKARQVSYRDRETRIGRITFSYRFGTNDRKGKGKHSKEEYKPEETKDRDAIKDKSEDGGF
ncbi:MAG: outer membrane beta-barrel family protein [Flavipsychrobacter sp.]